MTEDQSIITRLRNVVSFAYNNKQSSWYRDQCMRSGIKCEPSIQSIEDFSKLPVIEREHLADVPISARAFTDPKKANDIRSTSGTSGQAPLFYLRDVYYHEMSRRMYVNGVRKKIFFWNYHVSTVLTHADYLAGIETVICDPHQLEKSVELVKLLSTDTLAGSPSILLMFGELLKGTGANTQIKNLQLNGEAATPHALNALRKLFPKAGHYSDYSLGEVGQDIGIRTPQCNNQSPGYYHINTKDVYVEVLNNELLVTRLATPTVTPLIRYKTGDHISWVKYDECDCGHKGLSLKMAGRQNVDFVRIAGVEIRDDEILAIIQEFKLELENFVYTEVRDQVVNNTQLITLRLSVVAIHKDTESLIRVQRELQTALLERLRVSSTTVLQDMVQARIFNIPEIVFLPSIPVSNKRQGVKLIMDEI